MFQVGSNTQSANNGRDLVFQVNHRLTIQMIIMVVGDKQVVYAWQIADAITISSRERCVRTGNGRGVTAKDRID